MTFFTTIKMALGALALGVGSAVAATVEVNLEDGQSYSIGTGTEFTGFFNVDADELGDNTFNVDFTVEQGGTGDVAVSLTPRTANEFVNLVIAFLDDEGNVLSSTGVGGGMTELTTVFSGDNLFQTLQITFDESGSADGFDGDILIATVPVPAGGLLLLSALGAGVVMRRRKAAA
ncbi:MAG: hypothetical protein ACU0BS_03835 [Hasllibacter sp.]